ncbi:hypothetical protein KGQ27_00095 [Patescibacteria group bacterium]|nr:hypothetical protein [Patescibacteria group bacterium]MDE1946617.1 hypothetical protein [Patescibacteria group bacterium]MDE2010571.1 hypothetical protein [Patescibacteria group bacterium]MDE2233159.1 hypothetical protein [Patescibacteria group bacterium]
MEKQIYDQETMNEVESNEKLPKTKFEQIDIGKETELFYDFMKSSRWSAVFDRVYPELREIQKESKDKDECLKRYGKFVEGIHARDKGAMLSAQEYVQTEWEKIGQAFLEVLSEHFETDWPEDRHEIIGYVSALPAYPRFLKDYSFCVGYKNVANMIETAAHEILHFLWFKKWAEIFPETDKKEFESPHLVWRLSEIMDPIILQCHPEISKLIKPVKWGYQSFVDLKIGEKSMSQHFTDIYKDCLGRQLHFDEILKIVWGEAQRHREVLEKF